MLFRSITKMPDVELILNDKSAYEIPGKVEAIGGVIDRNTGTVSLRAKFPNPSGLLRSGGSGNVVVPVEVTNCLVIHRTATFEIQNLTFVYTIAEGKAKAIPVDVTRVNGGKEYIVNSGLNSGDVIITEGVALLREGTPVAAKNSSSASN